MFSKELFNMGLNNLITVYIVLFVLRRMRARLGLEATLEFAESYMKKMERENQRLRQLAYKALEDVDIEKMYKDARL